MDSRTPTPTVAPSWIQRRLCGDCFKPSEAQTDEGHGDPNPAAVATLLGMANDAVEDERERGRNLDTKCGTIVGFTGLILTVTAAITPTLVKRHLGSLGQPLADAAFVLAILSLLVAVVLALIGVLMPQKYRSLGKDQLAQFTWVSVQARSEMWVQQSMLGALRDILAQDRPVNDCKARLMKMVAWSLVFGFGALAVAALILGVHQFGS
jgi:hypothetical protein